MNYKDLKAPKKDMEEELEFDDEMLSELDLESEGMEESSDLTSFSDDELLAELKARGLDGSEPEEDSEELDLEDEDDELLA